MGAVAAAGPGAAAALAQPQRAAPGAARPGAAAARPTTGDARWDWTLDSDDDDDELAAADRLWQQHEQRQREQRQQQRRRPPPEGAAPQLPPLSAALLAELVGTPQPADAFPRPRAAPAAQRRQPHHAAMHNELILGLCHDIWDEATTPLASMLRTGETEANCPVVLREPVRARRDNRATYNSGACRAHLVRHCLWKLILVAPSQEPFMRRFIADAAAAAELEDAASPQPSPPPTPPPLELSLRLTGASDDDFFLDANGTWPPLLLTGAVGAEAAAAKAAWK